MFWECRASLVWLVFLIVKTMLENTNRNKFWCFMWSHVHSIPAPNYLEFSISLVLIIFHVLLVQRVTQRMTDLVLHMLQYNWKCLPMNAFPLICLPLLFQRNFPRLTGCVSDSSCLSSSCTDFTLGTRPFILLQSLTRQPEIHLIWPPVLQKEIHWIADLV